MTDRREYTARERRWAVYGGLTVVVIMSGFIVLSRSGLRADLSAADLTFFRYASGLLLLPIFLRRSPLTLCHIGWRRGLFLTICAGAPFNMILVGGFAFAPAAHGGVFGPGAMPLFTVLLAWAVLGNRPGRYNLGGLALIIAGLVAIGGGGILESGPGTWKCDLMFLGAAILWAAFTVAIRAWNVDPINAIVVVAVLSFAGFAPIYLIFLDGVVLRAEIGTYWFQALYQLIPVGIGATILFVRAVPILGPARTALINSMIPPAAVLLAIPLLGEIPGALEFAGIGVVILGMLAAMGIRPANPFKSRQGS